MVKIILKYGFAIALFEVSMAIYKDATKNKPLDYTRPYCYQENGERKTVYNPRIASNGDKDLILFSAQGTEVYYFPRAGNFSVQSGTVTVGVCK